MMSSTSTFSRDLLRLDEPAEIHRIASSIRSTISGVLHRRGAVVAVSGGVDSAVCAALCARALGAERVLALFLPDRDSSPESVRLGRIVAEQFGISWVSYDLSATLDSLGCYQAQAEAVRRVYPEFSEGWKFKLTLPSVAGPDRLNISRLTVRDGSGVTRAERIPLQAYLQLVAATNFKQRTRKMLEYYHADRLNYAVCGTPNRLEYDQGFFVKGGDGLADFKPIAHLYKTQVYALGRCLGVPEEICERTPTTDTFPLEQTQEEFYFGVPFDILDACLFGLNNGYGSAAVASAVGLSTEQVERLFRDIETKRRTTLPLHLPPVLFGPLPEIEQLKRAALENTPGV
jgi:NAD+ synthase